MENSLLFNDGLQNLLKDTLTYHVLIQTLMAQLAKVMTQENFNCKSFQFSGEFSLECQENISMLLNGPDVQDQA